jgi:hypothetical protein
MPLKKEFYIIQIVLNPKDRFTLNEKRKFYLWFPLVAVG